MSGIATEIECALIDALHNMFRLDLDAGAPQSVGDQIAVCMTLRGVDKMVLFAFPTNLAEDAAAQALAISRDEVEASDMQDAMREIANIVAGRLLGACFPEGAIGLPSMVTLETVRAPYEAGDAIAHFEAAYHGREVLIVVTNISACETHANENCQAAFG